MKEEGREGRREEGRVGGRIEGRDNFANKIKRAFLWCTYPPMNVPLNMLINRGRPEPNHV